MIKRFTVQRNGCLKISHFLQTTSFIIVQIPRYIYYINAFSKSFVKFLQSFLEPLLVV